MATEVTMPRLSDSMEEGTILKWLVDEGGEVKRGEPLVEIETDKANMTYEADTSGTLIEVVADEGDTLAIGEVIARIGEQGEKPSGGSESKGSEESEEEPEQDSDDEPSGQESPDGSDKAEQAVAKAEEAKDHAREAKRALGGSENGSDGDRVKASPVARRMAQDMGVELAQLEGSGPGGRIVKADVEAAAKGGGTKTEERQEDGGAPDEAPPETEAPKEDRKAVESGAKGEVETQELTRLQRTVSRRMAESKATAPDYVLHMEVDMSLCVELRKRLKEVEDPAPSFNDMVVKACANALRENPRVNGAYRDGQFELYSAVNVGVAVAAQDTLVVPTIHDADKKSLGEIARQARGLIEKVRDGKITPPELSGGTFTVSNLGMYGVDSFSAVINPPQAAILTVGALKKRPAVDEGGRIVARDSMTLSLVCDHRILYGADGAQFLARVRELLEQPLALAL
jgi:pyruvate dehydrogenase E2 component (dihydrolipoyllysine-residue acetyltransferase)